MGRGMTRTLDDARRPRHDDEQGQVRGRVPPRRSLSQGRRSRTEPVTAGFAGSPREDRGVCHAAMTPRSHTTSMVL